MLAAQSKTDGKKTTRICVYGTHLLVHNDGAFLVILLTIQNQLPFQ